MSVCTHIVELCYCFCRVDVVNMFFFLHIRLQRGTNKDKEHRHSADFQQESAFWKSVLCLFFVCLSCLRRFRAMAFYDVQPTSPTGYSAQMYFLPLLAPLCCFLYQVPSFAADIDVIIAKTAFINNSINLDSTILFLNFHFILIKKIVLICLFLLTFYRYHKDHGLRLMFYSQKMCASLLEVCSLCISSQVLWILLRPTF